jgi:hypothetical protein
MPLLILRPVANGKDIGLKKAFSEKPHWQEGVLGTNFQLRRKAQMPGTAGRKGRVQREKKEWLVTVGPLTPWP